MTLLYPLGLLSLLIIPVLILIYIIKNKYTEKTIPSTYLWTLSERFLKRRTPINKIVGIIGLILQILVAVMVSFALSHPVFLSKGKADDYLIIIDGSASMTATYEGKSRFSIAKEEAAKIIERSETGSTYSLIYASGTADFVFRGVEDKAAALLSLGSLEPGYSIDATQTALSAAQELFYDNPSVKIYLFTDAKYPSSDNVTVVTVGGETVNYAVLSAGYKLTAGGVRVSGKALSDTLDSDVTLELYFDGEDSPYDSLVLSLPAGTPTEFAFDCDRVSFSYFRVAVGEEDSQPLDDSVTVYNLDHDNAERTLLISDAPTIFLRGALISAGLEDVETVKKSEYLNKRGYGLYIFDGVLPEELPDDGAVWFINPQGSVSGSGFSYQGSAEAKSAAEYSTSTSSTVAKLLRGVSTREFELRKYVKCGLSGRFTTLLSCEGSPVIFAGINAYGNREAVFAFDLRDAAAFTISDSFAVLTDNLIDYSFPSVIDSSVYECGKSAEINIIPGTVGVKIVTPKKKEVYLDTSGELVEYALTEVGVYTVSVTIKDGSLSTARFYSAYPESESYTVAEGEFIIEGNAAPSVRSGKFDGMLIVLIVLLVLTVADYGVYCYEQYQLR